MKAEIDKHHFEDKLAFFPYGVQYYRAPTPLPEEWETDLREIARAGYTHLQFRPQWRWHERIRGAATWQDLDILFDLASQYKLRVVLKPMLETAPDWVFEELDGARIGFHGVPLSPRAHAAFYVGGWLPCFDNPGVVKAAEQFVGLLTSRYALHPALWAYDAWNEPRSRPLGQCHCAHSQAAYRNWLKSRFGDIENLNKFAGKAWTSWDSVHPPASLSDYFEMQLWRQWAGFSVAGQIRFVSAAIRKAHPSAFIMAHVGCSTVVGDPICDTTDDLLNAREVDRYGTSAPVDLHPRKPTEHAFLDYQADWMRRVDQRYWCHEFYPNTANWALPPETRTLTRLVWQAIAGGAGAFTFWQYRSERFGEESNGFGLRNIDGSATPRSRVADGIAQVLKEYGNRLAGARRLPARIALLYSRPSDMCMRIQRIRHQDHNIQLEVSDTDYPYRRSLRAVHALYQMAGETTDFVVPGDGLDGITLLHVSCAEIIEKETASWLRSFVKRGGKLVIEFPFACRDERTWVVPRRPDHGLEDLLGCIEADRVISGNESRHGKYSRPADSAEFPGGIRIPAREWRIDLNPCGGEVLAKWQDGAVAAVRSCYGAGTVYALGVNVSLAFNNNWDDPALKFFEWILHDAGLEPCPWRTPRLWLRRRRGKEHEIWFVFNLGKEQERMELPVMPRQVWVGEDCQLERTGLMVGPGATWVAEMPVVTAK
jgi:beta-galactosidase GanA